MSGVCLKTFAYIEFLSVNFGQSYNIGQKKFALVYGY